jgi:hypothetical protein
MLGKAAVAFLLAAPLVSATFLRQAKVAADVKFEGGARGVLTSVENEGAMIAQKVEKTIDHVRKADDGSEGSQGGAGSRILFQLLFGVLYYFLIVSKYPTLEPEAAKNPKAAELQEKNPVMATFGGDTTLANCFLSFCCSGPRAAHTFHSTGILSYWFGLVLMTCFPCCTLFAVNSFTELNVKLGGEKAGIIQSCVCAFCCNCCVIAQDAESLDLMTGAKTGFVGVENPAA